MGRVGERMEDWVRVVRLDAAALREGRLVGADGDAAALTEGRLVGADGDAMALTEGRFVGADGDAAALAEGRLVGADAEGELDGTITVARLLVVGEPEPL